MQPLSFTSHTENQKRILKIASKIHNVEWYNKIVDWTAGTSVVSITALKDWEENRKITGVLDLTAELPRSVSNPTMRDELGAHD